MKRLVPRSPVLTSIFPETRIKNDATINALGSCSNLIKPNNNNVQRSLQSRTGGGWNVVSFYTKSKRKWCSSTFESADARGQIEILSS